MDIDTILSDEDDDIHATSSSSEDEDVEALSKTNVNVPLNQNKKKQGAVSAKNSLFDDLVENNASAIEAAQSWDFRDAIERMKREKPNSNQTSLDEKIRRAVEQRKQQTKEESGDENSDSENSGEEESSDDDEKNGEDSDNETKEKDKAGSTRPLAAMTSKAALEREREKRVQEQQRATSFAELQLSRPLLRATQTLNYAAPTPIQAEAIPLILKGKDVLASAVTGSGKTAAYLLPVVERLLLRDRRSGPVTRVLIIVPTRELAQQISSMLEKLCQYCNDISQTVVVGGLSTTTQALALRARPDIIIATPGRLIDHLRNTVSFDMGDLEILILDEADRLLELGFLDELREIIKYSPKERQTLLFSATISSDVSKLADLSLDNPARIATDPLFDVAQRLVQEFVRVRKTTSALPAKEAEEEQLRRREALLLALCTHTTKNRTIIFFQHKHQAHRACIAFGLLGLKCAELHGNLTQAKRLEALQRFRDGNVDFLFCTDLAARGIDVPGVQCVINFELPKDLTTYIHRVGRTARAGRGGRSISLVGDERRSTMKELLKSSSSALFQSRTVASSSAQKAFERLKAIQKEVGDILSQEHLEREIRLAEMDATKAENIALHQDEIMSRPKKTWFISGPEKLELKQKAKDVFEGKTGDAEVEEDDEENDQWKKNNKKDKNKPERIGNRAKRRRAEAREREEKDLKRAAREARNNPNAEDDDHPKPVTASKKLMDALIPAELKQKVAARAAKKKARNPSSDERDEDGDLVDLNKESKRKARLSSQTTHGKRENFVAKRTMHVEDPKFKEQSAAVKLRKGGKKSVHSFKSKAKFKRRK